MKSNEKEQSALLVSAERYIKRGWAIVPIPYQAKVPNIREWQNLRLSQSDFSQYFNGRPQNVGVILGEASGGLVDVDLDSPEAVKIANYFLQQTQASFGRAGNPESHRLYTCRDAIYQKFNDPVLLSSKNAAERKKACIVEIRTSPDGKGLQTVFPPSTHESGEKIEWVRDAVPLQISYSELQKSVSRIAAAALLAKYWPDGIRQDLALALCGTLLRHGFDNAETKHFLKAVCVAANDEEISKRLAVVEDTAKKLKKNEKVFGIPKLTELTDGKIVAAVCNWLKIQTKVSEKASDYIEAEITNFRVVCLSDVNAEEIEWLWKPFIPIGEFTIIEGIEGLGKSWISCALACAVAAGAKLPFSENEPIEPSNVLMLSAEDSLSHTVKPRLLSMRANLNNIFALDDVFSLNNENDLIRFEAVIAEYNPKLVIVDPLFSYTGGKNLNQESESRPLARKLIAIAQKYNCAIIGIRHIGKAKGNGDARAAGLGSVAWRASARSVLIVGSDAETNEKAICQTKNNLAEESKIAVGFEITSDGFYWKAVPSQLTKEKMLAQPKGEEARAEQSEAVAFLLEALSEGERPSKDIEKESKDAGITVYALRKAKTLLGVVSVKRGGNFGGAKEWFVKLPEAENVESNTEEVDSSDTQHLQPRQSEKTSYHNNLAEDVENTTNQHLQQPEATSSTKSAQTVQMPEICKCGANGFVGELCPGCGEIIIPF